MSETHDPQAADPQSADLQAADLTQQVTSKSPTTRPKNPRRVAAGKAIAAKTKQAHEAPKKLWIRLMP